MSNILFVCTANICRSPAAEAIAKQRFGGGAHRFASAGFLYEGRSPTPEMVKALDTIGIDARSHVSHIINEERAASAHLILTMEARHVQDIGIMSADAFAKTLPLVEAAERLSARPMNTADFVASLADRDSMAYLDPKWDVEDPYKRSKRKYRKAVDQISTLVDTVLRPLS